MRIRLACFALGALGTLVGACVSQAPNYDVLAFCTDYAQAMCQVANTCSVDSYGCQQYEFNECKTHAVDATSPQTRLFNADNAHLCVLDLQGIYGDNATTVSAAQLQSCVDVCERVYLGLAAAGDFCRIDYDCGAGLVCAPKMPGGTPVVCAAPISVQQGQSCAAPGSQCASDTYCASHTGGTWQCDPSPASGEACAAQVYCASTDHCVKTICQPRGQAGDPCVSSADCSAGSPYCDPYSSTCAAGLTFHPGSIDCRGVAGLTSTPDAALEGNDPDGSAE